MGAGPTAVALAAIGEPGLVVAIGAASVGLVVFLFFLVASWVTRTTVVPDLGFPVEEETREERRERQADSRVERLLATLDGAVDGFFDALAGW